MSGTNQITDEMINLYQEVILDHNKNPRNFGPLPEAHVHQEGFNPLCGDHIFLHIQFAEESNARILDIKFEGDGCAISKASSSLMTAAIKGKTKEESLELFLQFQRLLTRNLDPENEKHQLGKLSIFSGIWKYPSRVKCAGLCWHTLKAALEGERSIAKTE